MNRLTSSVLVSRGSQKEHQKTDIMIHPKRVAGQCAPTKSPSDGNGQAHANGQSKPDDHLTAEESARGNGKADGHHGNGFFAMVPLEIAAREDLSLGAKLLFGIIDSLRRAALGRCVASNEELARRIGKSVSEARRFLIELDKAGLIARDMAHGRRQEIRVTWESGMSEISNHRRAPANTRRAPVNTENTLEKKKRKKTTTTYSGRSPREPEGDGEPAKSSSSFVASLPESGGTGGTHARRLDRDEAIDPARLKTVVSAVLALGLRRYKDDAAPLDTAQAETLIRGAAQKWSGGLRWVAWAVHHAVRRRNPAKGKKAVEVWGWIVGTMQRWSEENSGPPESDGWPGERAARPRQTAEQQPFNPRA